MIICIQCAAIALVERQPYHGEPDATMEEHIMRVHPDPIECREERKRLMRMVSECVCRTPGCGHGAVHHGPKGFCAICKKECWS